MKGKAHTTRRIFHSVALAASLAALAAPAAVAGSPGLVPGKPGSPDTRKAALSNAGDFMFRDYFRGTHYAAGGEPAAQVAAVDRFSWGKLEIGALVGTCSLVLLILLGVGARQLRGTRHASEA